MSSRGIIIKMIVGGVGGRGDDKRCLAIFYYGLTIRNSLQNYLNLFLNKYEKLAENKKPI